MSDHTYQPGDRVERISTGEVAPFREIVESSFGNFISTQPTCGLEEIMGAKAEPHWWPADDCRPVIKSETLSDITCTHCGKVMTYDSEDNDAKERAIFEMTAHDIGCPQNPLRAELAAKDAEIARLNATINGLSDDLMTPYLLGVEHGKDAAAKVVEGLEQALVAEKDAYHKLANEAQAKYTKLYASERENASLRKLCGDVNTVLAPMYQGVKLRRSLMEQHGKMGMIEDVEDTLFRKLRAAAEGGE